MEVKVTTNYDLFKTLKGNRNTDQNHVLRLGQTLASQSFGNKYTPIVINKNMEIIDGQHRFEALKQLGMPVHYIINDEAELADVIAMNSVNKNWAPLDYAKAYAHAGKKHYTSYLELMERYNISHRIVISYMFGSDAEGGTMTRRFRAGQFNPRDIKAIIADLERLREIGEEYPKWKSAAFAVAMLKVMSSPEYDHRRMLRKMAEQGHTIPRMSGREDNIRAIERVYNHSITGGNRVRFDYGD